VVLGDRSRKLDLIRRLARGAGGLELEPRLGVLPRDPPLPDDEEDAQNEDHYENEYDQHYEKGLLPEGRRWRRGVLYYDEVQVIIGLLVVGIGIDIIAHLEIVRMHRVVRAGR